MKQYFSFQWHITDECDQRCKYCYIFSENCNKKPDAMSWQQMQDTFYNCLDFCQVYDRLPYFYITGGDPILHPDFWKLLGLMKQHSVPFTILGNPFHLTDEICRKLKEYGCEKYQLSIDGLRGTHDWFRKPGSFDITLEKIGCINRAGIRSVVMTTVSGTNIDEVPGIIDAVVAAGVNVFAFVRYCPTSEEKDVGIEPLRYRKLLSDCDRKFMEYEAAGCQTYFNKKDHLWTLYTVGPIISGRVTKEDKELLASCYRSCLELAAENKLESVAFCCISTGEFHFPNELAAEIAVRTVKDFLKIQTSVKKVIFNVFKALDKAIYEKLLGAA